MNALTPIQVKVLQFIVSEIDTKALPPTHREISRHFKWTSNAAAKCHLLALEKKGMVKSLIRISRGLQIKPAARELLAERAAAPRGE